MALIQCAECKREISDRALACPGCGAPVAAHTTNTTSGAAKTPLKRTEKIAVTILLVSAIPAVFVGISSGSWIAGTLTLFGVGGILYKAALDLESTETVVNSSALKQQRK